MLSLFLHYLALATTGAPPILELLFLAHSNTTQIRFPWPILYHLASYLHLDHRHNDQPLVFPNSDREFCVQFFWFSGSKVHVVFFLCLTTNPVSLFSHVTYVSLWSLFILSSLCVFLIKTALMERMDLFGVHLFFLVFSFSFFFSIFLLLVTLKRRWTPFPVLCRSICTTEILVVPLPSTHDLGHSLSRFEQNVVLRTV